MKHLELFKKNVSNGDVYSLELSNIVSFFEEYNYNKLTRGGVESFLKALKIPVKYFLQQPHETRIELLQNQISILNSSKKLFVLVEKEVIVFVASTDIDVLDNATDLCPVQEGWLYRDEDMGSGYRRYFIPVDSSFKDEYTLGVFIDYPILFHKPLVVQTGFYKKATEGGVDIEVVIPGFKIKLKGTEVPDSDSNAYFSDIINELKLSKPEEFLEAMKNSNIDREIAVNQISIMIDKKLANKGLLKSALKYVSKPKGKKKEQVNIVSHLGLLDILFSFVGNLSSYSSRNKAKEDITHALSVITKKKINAIDFQNFQIGY